jgi:GAF domain-containing protein/DNA-binding CsgD family transcriptional regulator
MVFTETRESRSRERQLATVAELGRRAMEDVDLSLLMDEAAALVSENLKVEYVKIFELQPDGESLLLRSGVGWVEGAVGQVIVDSRANSPVGYTLISEEPVVVEDLPSEKRFDRPPLLREHDVRSGVTVIIHGQERPFGVLGADTSKRRKFTSDDVNFLQAVANVLTTAIERRRATYTGAETPGLHFELLTKASMLLSSGLDCSSILTCIARLVVPEFADCCTVEVLEEGEVTRSAVAHVDPAKEDLVRKLQARYPVDPSNTSSSASEVLRTGQSKMIPDIIDTLAAYVAEESQELKMLQELHPTSYMCVPLMARGRILGVIRLASVKPGYHYGPEDLALAESLARFAALAIENAQLHLPELDLARGLVQLATKYYTISKSSNGHESSNGHGIPSLVPRPALTSRQVQVLELLSQGKCAKEIGQTLCLSEATIRNHIHSLLRTLGVRSQLEAVAQAREMGLLP